MKTIISHCEILNRISLSINLWTYSRKKIKGFAFGTYNGFFYLNMTKKVLNSYNFFVGEIPISLHGFLHEICTAFMHNFFEMEIQDFSTIS